MIAPFEIDESQFWTDEDFYHEEYCTRPFEVNCICGATETASEEQLRRNGWQLNRSGEVCPACEEYTKRVQALAEVARVAAC